MDRTALNRATESSDSPTPGYLYVDIAKSAAASPVASQEIVAYLIKRLQKNNPNVKHKVLKVIAKTAESPVTRGLFKRALSQDARAVGAIKECLGFRGPPDPVRGEEPYQRVRDAAKEALDAVYRDDPTSSAAAGPAGGYGGIGGGGGVSSSYGAPPHGAAGGMGGGGYGAPPPGAGGMGGGGPKRMEGIGNPMFKDPRMEPQQNGMANMTVTDVAKAAGETIVGMIKDPLARNVPMHPAPQTRPGGPGRPGGFGSNSYSGPPGQNQLTASTGGQWTMASNRGPNAVAPPQNFERDQHYYKNRGGSDFNWAQGQAGGGAGAASSGGVGGSWGAAAPAPRPADMSVAAQSRAVAHGIPPPAPMGGAPAAAPAGDGQYEKNLVMELCPPGGMKAEPPVEKLQSFIRSIPSLNPDFVCPALLDGLEDGQPWIIKAKALCVIESIIKASEESSDGDSNPYSDFFHTCSGEIEPLAGHARSAIRDPARRVLKLLGIDGASVAVAQRKKAVPPPVPAPAPPPPNLLDFDDEPASTGAPTAPPPAAAPPPPAPDASSGDMFGGLTTKAPTPAAPTPAAPAPAAPAPAPPAGDMFGGMTVKTDSGAAAPVANGVPEQTPTSAGLFDDVNVKSSASGEAAVSVGQAAAGSGSAFGFISGGGDAALGAAPAPVAPPAAAPESFDPLLSLGAQPTQEQKMQQTQAQIAQMQTMAYQKNLMMMQQQMQQMQMAMAMQAQGRGSGTVPSQMMMQGRQASGGSLSGSLSGVPASMAPMNPNVMKANAMRQIPGTGDASSSFSFLDNPNQQKKQENHAFDFVMDSMKTEGKK